MHGAKHIFTAWPLLIETLLFHIIVEGVSDRIQIYCHNNNMVYVISATKIVITQLLATIRSKVGQKELEAPAQFKKVCNDQSWLSLCDKVYNAHSVLIGVSPTEDQVIIVGDTTQLAA